MASKVGALTQKRKQNLRNNGRAHNSIHDTGRKPSGPHASGYGDGGTFIGTPTEAWASLFGGAAIGTYGVLELINRRSKIVNGLLAVIGGGLLYRGISGLLRPHDGMTEDETGLENPAASVQHLAGVKIEEAVTIHKPHRELYDYWRELSNLPNFMEHLERVEVLDDTTSHWVAKSPFGTDVEWDAEIYIERVGEMLSWRSVEGSELETAGSVHFNPLGEDKTKVSVMMKIEPAVSDIGIALAKLFGEDPASMVKQDMKRFKKLMEASEEEKDESAGSLEQQRNGNH